MNQIISCKSSPFSFHDVAFQGTIPTPQALWPNTFNNCFEINLTKVGFGNGGHCSAIIISLPHSHWVLAQVRLATFWSLCLYIAMAFLKMQTFILAWSWCRGPLSKVENLLSLAFCVMKPCTPFKCLVNNHLAQYVTM
jgi:hypothetical protein